MGKKLYKVTGEMVITVMIVADSEEEAEHLAEDAVRDEYHENGFTREWDCGRPRLVERLEQLPESWRAAIPYGDDEQDRTCLQVLDDYVPEGEPLGEQTSIEGTEDGDA